MNDACTNIHDIHTLISYIHACTYIQDSFNISDGIDGSVTSYTITIFSSTGESCDSITLQASTCGEEIYNYRLENLTSSCYSSSSQVMLTVFASNIIGDGVPSVPTFVGMFVPGFIQWGDRGKAPIPPNSQASSPQTFELSSIK